MDASTDQGSCAVVLWDGRVCGKEVRDGYPSCTAHTARLLAGWTGELVGAPWASEGPNTSCGVAVDGFGPCSRSLYRNGICNIHHRMVAAGRPLEEFRVPLPQHPRCGWASVEGICNTVVPKHGGRCARHDLAAVPCPPDGAAPMESLVEKGKAVIAAGRLANSTRADHVRVARRVEALREELGLAAGGPIDTATAAAFLVASADPTRLDPDSSAFGVRESTLGHQLSAIKWWNGANGFAAALDNEKLDHVVKGAARGANVAPARPPKALFRLESFIKVALSPPPRSPRAAQRRAIVALSAAGWDTKRIANSGRCEPVDDGVVLRSGRLIERFVHDHGEATGTRPRWCTACLLGEADAVAPPDAAGLFRPLFDDRGVAHRNVTRGREIRLVLQHLRRCASLVGRDIADLDDADVERLLVFADAAFVEWLHLVTYCSLLFLKGQRHKALATARLGSTIVFADDTVTVTLVGEKGDRFHNGREPLVYRALADDRLCPVTLCRRLADLVGAVGGERLFGRVTRGFVDRTKPVGSDTMNDHLREALVRVGIDPDRMSTYSMRHGFTADARDAGYTDADIAKVLGHRSLATTAQYGRVNRTRKGAAAIADKIRDSYHPAAPTGEVGGDV